jgi:hypothetical protein
MRRVISIVAVALVALVVVAAAIALLWPALGRRSGGRCTPTGGGSRLGPAAALALLGWPFIAFLRHPTGSTWRNNVLTAASALEGRIQVVRATPRRVRKIP